MKLIVCFFSLFIFCNQAYSKDTFKMLVNSHYVTGYWDELVREALEITAKEYGEYDIRLYKEVIGNERHTAELQKGELVNVRIGVASDERQKMYIPVKIPLRKGLLNYRLLVAKKSDEVKYSQLTTLDELRKFKFGLVDSWVTTDILKRNSFDVVPVNDSGRLFGMLAADRYDLTMRGTNEVFTELNIDDPNGEKYAVVPNIGVYINTPTYIFVSKQAPVLAERLTKGLEIMLDNGQFDEIFYRWHKDHIDKANLKKRFFIEIDNPTLTLDAIPKEKKYWLPSVLSKLE
ncbi:transporter substrate-binding domain-containing protein [Alteromonas sp. 5E99-2]|uniref:substrate-binding periplasmic protein n=1 Tax=Alteromonas sp. 5E99-2 TaxID=2817683 RepID=UPI001A98A6EE|nr:transporter substrate-binding domain-containing protein [Alteromonas sp. 5E99-2]MBO1255894.1 transporter substrate-binding domain-containing protein [Alteromonas sp. 5E99-2]